MTAKPPPILVLGSDHWRLLSTVASGVEARELDASDAAGLAEAIAAHHPPSTPVMVVLPADRCYAARLDHPEEASGSRAWRRACLYALEEKLPITAEEVVADYIAGAEGVLGVCCLLAPLAGVIESLEAAGVRVGAVTPMAILVVDEAVRSVAPRPRAVAVSEGASLNLVTLDSDGIEAWHTVPNRVEDMVARLQILTGGETGGDQTVLLVGEARELAPGLQSAGYATREADETPEQFLCAAAARLAEAGRRPAVDLRRDQLAGPRDASGLHAPAVAALVSIVFLMLSAVAACLIAAHRYDAEAAELRQAQQAVYRQIVPGARDQPPDVARRLASHRRAMAASAGVVGDPTGGPSSLTMLRDIYERLPIDAGIRPSRISINGAVFELRGQAPSHGEAAQLADLLGMGALFTVQAPQTRALLDGTVEFTIRGERRGEGGRR